MKRKPSRKGTAKAARRGGADAGARKAATRLMTALAFALAASGLVASRAAEAQILSGEPSFRWENQVDVQYLAGQGVGSSFSGTGIGLEYAYQLRPWLWLDLGFNARQSRCGFVGDCSRYTGNAAELIAGVKWHWRAKIPVVPYARLGAGPLFLFPSEGKNVAGYGGRGDVGFRYYFTDWLGLGMGFGMTLGRASYADGYGASRVVQVIDLVLGTAFQF